MIIGVISIVIVPGGLQKTAMIAMAMAALNTTAQTATEGSTRGFMITPVARAPVTKPQITMGMTRMLRPANMVVIQAQEHAKPAALGT